MPAETAAATGAIVESGGVKASPTSQGSEVSTEAVVPNEREEILSEPIGDRLKSILGNMELPTDVLEGTLAEEAGKQESREEAEEEGAVEEEPKGKTKPAVAEEELTEEQKTQWAPEALARIHKATAQRETARKEAKAEKERAEALERENADLKSRVNQTPVLGPTPANPLAHIQTPEQMSAVEAELEHCLSWTRLNPDGGVYVPLGKREEDGQQVAAAEVPKLLNDVDFTLRKIVPLRKDFLQEQNRQTQIARADYPDLFNKESEDSKLAQMVIEQMPDLLRFPDAMLNIGIYVEGLKAYRDRKVAAATASNGNGKTPKNPAVAAFTRPQPPRAPALPRVQRPSTETARPDLDTKAAEEEAAASAGSPEAMEALVRSLRAKQSNKRGGMRLTSA